MKNPLNFDIAVEIWDRVRSSLWIVPGLIAAGAFVLAILTPYLDRTVPIEWLLKLPGVFSGEPAGARAVLSTIATSIITLAGVVFSMTIVSLQLASSQFGPRLLRTFLRDRGNQIVLGTFVGIFLYCVMVLPAVDATSESEFVPHIAVTLAVILALIGLAMLVYFIDHVAQSIHADAVIYSVAREMETVVERLFPDRMGEGADEIEADDELPAATADTPAKIKASLAGYVRFINSEAILTIASELDLIVRLDVDPGQYVLEGDQIASVWPQGSVNKEVNERLRNAITLGAHRTALQDPRFVFAQLSEMAVRALSPGINDPTTAIHCIDRIASGLASIASRKIPSSYRRDDEGEIRAIVRSTSLADLLEITIQTIQRNAAHHLAVWLRLMSALESVLERANREDDRRDLLQVAEQMHERAQSSLKANEEEKKRLTDAYQALKRIDQSRTAT